MSSRCTFAVAVPDRKRRVSRTLRERYPEIFDGFEPAAFDDLPTDEDGVWRCPRVADSSDRCPLHADGTPDAEKRAAIDRALEGESDPDAIHPDANDDAAGTRFVGVELSTLDLRRCQYETADAGPIDLRCAEIDRLRLDGASLRRPLRLEDARVGTLSATGLSTERAVRLRHATVEDGMEATDATIGGRLDCRFAQVGGDVALTGTTADGRFDFGFTVIDGRLEAEKGACRGRFTLKEATVEAVDAERVAVSGPDPDSDIPGLQFRGLETAGDVDIVDCRCEGQLLGYKMAIGRDFDAAESRIEGGVSLGSEAGTNLPEAAVAGSLDFANATIEGRFKMLGREGYGTNPTVGGKLDLAGATVDRLDLTPALTHDAVRVVDCRGTVIRSGRLGQPTDADPVVYDLTEATLGDVSLEADRGSVADRILFDRTTFDGFAFDETEREDFDRADWRIHECSPERRRDVAFVRAFHDADEYARDLRAICLERPGFREWVLATDPPYEAATAARALFDPTAVRDGGSARSPPKPRSTDGTASDADAETARTTDAPPQEADPLEPATIDRIAKNGPETADQLGPRLFRRERYRYGLVTYLAREYGGAETPAGALLSEAGEAVRRVAEAADRVTAEGSSRPEELRDATLAARDRFAAVLADPSAVAPTLTERELTYLQARHGADDVGDSTTAANFFVNELRTRRAIHRRRAREASSVRETATHYWNAGTNALLDLVAGYGERPGRSVVASIGTVLAFALGYWLLWLFLPAFSSSMYGGPFGAVLLSLDAFTSLVLGGVEVEARFVRFVAALEAFLGAFLIALFVFTLTRSLHR